MKKTNRNQVKGSVLFTVVTVMMVMVVFLMSTLILTASSQKRTYYTYYQKQAQFACQSALDVITQQLYGYATGDNEARSELQNNSTFYDWVKNEVTTPGEQKEIFIEYYYEQDGAGNETGNVSGNANVMGIQPDADGKNVVECTIEKLRDKHIIWDPVNNLVLAQDQWKITATATVGSGRNAADYTICNYIYDEIPASGTAGVDAPENTANWQLMTGLTPSTTETEVPLGPVEDGRQGSIANALYTMSPVVGASANNLICLGPQMTNLTSIPAGRGNYGAANDNSNSIQNRNDMISVGQVTIVGNVYQNTHWDYTFQTAGEGAVIYGNYTGANNMTIQSTMNPQPSRYKDFAYFYVDGIFTPAQFNAQSDQPVTLHCGAIQKGNQVQFVEGTDPFSDIYLHDPALESTIHLPNGATNLYAFAFNNIYKDDVGTKTLMGGDIISNNSKLTITGNGGSVIQGDVVMANPLGELVLSGDIVIQGAVVCAGTLTFTGSNTTVNGGIAAASMTGTPGSNPKATVMAQSLGMTAEMQPADALNHVCPRYNNDNNAAANGYVNALSGDLQGNAEKYNYSLFPFGSRLDEIFECYIRWDLAEADHATASAHINTDPLILESRSAGHAWDVKAKVYEGEGGAKQTVYVPYTTPVFKNDHASIKELNTMTSAEAIPNVITNREAFNAKFPGLQPITPRKLADGETVTIISHEGDSNLTQDDKAVIANGYIVNQSGIIDLSQFPANQEIDVFVDPYQTGGTMAIVLTGTVSNSIVNFVVNNTADYTFGTNNAAIDYNNPAPFYANKKCAGRADVVFYLDNPENERGNRYISNKPFNITTTGAYRQMKAKKYNVVSNPYYPNQDKYENLDDSEKFRFELVPNIVVYGEAGTTYEAQNGIGVSGEVLMPMSTFYSPSGEAYSKATCTYREFHDSVPYTMPTNMNPNCNGVGTFCAREFKGENVPMTIYLGDLYRVHNPVDTVEKTKYDFGFGEEQNSQAAQIGAAIGNFGNDHQGAN